MVTGHMEIFVYVSPCPFMPIYEQCPPLCRYDARHIEVRHTHMELTVLFAPDAMTTH